jgi:hypothetical protein
MLRALSIVLVTAAASICFAEATTAPATTTAPSTSTKPSTETKPATKAADATPKRKEPLTIQGKGGNGSYIILFGPNVMTKDELPRLEKELGFKATHVYDSMPTFQGFAAKLNAASVEKLRWEPNIKLIERDGAATIQGAAAGAN